MIIMYVFVFWFVCIVERVFILSVNSRNENENVSAMCDRSKTHLEVGPLIHNVGGVSLEHLLARVACLCQLLADSWQEEPATDFRKTIIIV